MPQLFAYAQVAIYSQQPVFMFFWIKFSREYITWLEDEKAE